MSKLDYDCAFAQYKTLQSVWQHMRQLELGQPEYRIVAQSPFYLYPNGLLYKDEVVDACLMRHWRITTEFRLATEMEEIAYGTLHGKIPEEVLLHFNLRSRTFFPWLTLIGKAADRATLKDLKRAHRLN
ncbi:MAG: hypothetical protein AAB892_01235 [Patescibacteria group bacterium]